MHAAERQRDASVQKGHRQASGATLGNRDLWRRLEELQRAGLVWIRLGTKGEVMDGVYLEHFPNALRQ